jgi:hypothetical protein
VFGAKNMSHLHWRGSDYVISDTMVVVQTTTQMMPRKNFMKHFLDS